MSQAHLVVRIVTLAGLLGIFGSLAAAGLVSAGDTPPAVPSVVLVGSSAGEPTPGPGDRGPAAPAPVAMPDELDDDELLILRATRRLYERAGLEFPHAEIRFHPDTAPCRGYNGYYQGFSDGTQRVDVCHSDDSAQFADIQRTRILWHELAHAYLELRLDAATKSAFLEVYGLESWSDGDWDVLGSEYAAETLVWGISGGSYRLHSRLHAVECETLATGYEILTGNDAPGC